MKVVIEIPEEIRNALVHNIQLSLEKQSILDSYVKQAIINGTPLPKGHGRLIDSKEFEGYIRDGFRDLKGMFKTEEYLHLAEQLTESFLMDIQEQETVVPEDKEETE